MRNVTETDRRRNRKGESAKQQGGGSRAAKTSGRSELRTEQGFTCEVRKLPTGEGLYTLAAAAKRCHAKSDLKDYVITYDKWPDKLDTSLCPNHYCQLGKSKLVVLESIEECAEGVAQEEARSQNSSQLAQ